MRKHIVYYFIRGVLPQQFTSQINHTHYTGSNQGLSSSFQVLYILSVALQALSEYSDLKLLISQHWTKILVTICGRTMVEGLNF